ncbi:MAG: 2-isopropylmalate synthase [archaeon]|nr:2-isopropylmalate synthase [archaeon]
MEKKIIEIFDTTLRDGEQSPGATLTIDEKLKIACQLAKLKVDTIEAGFPIASNDDFKAVKLIAQNVEGPYICGLCRTVEEDIKRAWSAVKYSNKPCIHTFIATSDLHLQYKLKKTRDEAVEMAKNAVRLAKSLTDRVEFSAEDASRSDKEYLCKVIQTAIDEGAVVVNIPDTVGYSQPGEFGQLINYIKENVENIDKTIISVHCHDDLGLAVANSIEAVRRGAGQVEGTINGIGERAGNASLEEVIMNLRTRSDYFNCDTNIDTKQIYSTSKMVARYTGISVQRNKAIIGENAFAHEAGIHQHGMLSNPLCYEIMNPEAIGKKTQLIFGKHSGRHAIEEGLKKLKYKFSQEQLTKITQKIKDLADKQKAVLEEDIIAIADYELNKSSKKPKVVLEELSVMTGNMITPTAIVKVNVEGDQRTSTGYGIGPVDAATNAIRNILDSSIKLKEYNLKAITGGTDALVDISLVLTDKNKKEYKSRAIDADIVMASVKALINAMNTIERHRKD